MMKPVLRIDGCGACAMRGRPVIDPAKLAWNLLMAVGTALAIAQASLAAVAMFLVLTYVTLLVGHSIGMHRLLIHGAIGAPKPVERVLVYIGVLVGVAGPFGIVRLHDLRDWAQRQPECHDYFAHRRSLPRDLWWQLACRFDFDAPPTIHFEANLADDRFYRWLERSWRWHQLVIALPLYLAGGWAFVLWGVCARVLVSTAGHWTITYFCHRPQSRRQPGRWRVAGASVHAANLTGLGLITYGECWHNNHHAFPESARIGLDAGQPDPGWWLICAMARAGWLTHVGQPRPAAAREDLAPLFR
jgi:fatty-acid desaturase